jgi:hypothetical protein
MEEDSVGVIGDIRYPRSSSYLIQRINVVILQGKRIL